jgi:hypothetical protein
MALWLQTFETVTLLSFEPSMPRSAALAAWQERGEFVPYAQRHILRDWLLSGPTSAEAASEVSSEAAEPSPSKMALQNRR